MKQTRRCDAGGEFLLLAAQRTSRPSGCQSLGSRVNIIELSSGAVGVAGVAGGSLSFDFPRWSRKDLCKSKNAGLVAEAGRSR